MGYLEHEEGNPNCGCPSCDLADLYIQEYDEYKRRKPYAVFSANDLLSETLEKYLNERQAEGYELQAVTRDNSIIMRSVPPQPPTAREVLVELQNRQSKSDLKHDVKDDIGPTMGGMQ